MAAGHSNVFCVWVTECNCHCNSKAMPQGMHCNGFNFSGCMVTIYNAPVTMQASQSQQIELCKEDITDFETSALHIG